MFPRCLWSKWNFQWSVSCTPTAKVVHCIYNTCASICPRRKKLHFEYHARIEWTVCLFALPLRFLFFCLQFENPSFKPLLACFLPNFFFFKNSTNPFLLCTIKMPWFVHLYDHNFWNLLKWIVFRSLVSATNSNRTLPSFVRAGKMAKTWNSRRRKKSSTTKRISNWFKVDDQLTNTL